MLIGLCALYFALGALGLFGDGSAPPNVALTVVVAILLYVCAGYAAGVIAGAHQVLNASAVGLLFGVVIWIALWLLCAFEVPLEGPITMVGVAIGGGALAVVACGAGGIVAILLPYRRREG